VTSCACYGPWPYVNFLSRLLDCAVITEALAPLFPSTDSHKRQPDLSHGKLQSNVQCKATYFAMSNLRLHPA